MLAAIELNREFQLDAVKIRDVAADWMLPAKLAIGVSPIS